MDQISFLNADSGKFLGSVPAGADVHRLECSPDGKWPVAGTEKGIVCNDQGTKKSSGKFCCRRWQFLIPPEPSRLRHGGAWRFHPKKIDFCLNFLQWVCHTP
ncbi:MAG: hypothetical protein NTW21_36010 [Verrucomicrobia bacterium]|nr:hypothetical protein [Verrucomicrobiota bacterium]